MKRLETMTDWYSIGTDIKLDELRDYLETLNIQLVGISEDYENRINAKAALIEDDRDRDEFYEFSGDQYWTYKETFPRILLNSFHVTAYTILESELHSIAERIGKKLNQVFDVSEIKGNGYLESSTLYIKKLTQIDCKSFSSWNEIKEAQRIRNIIVHLNGKIVNEKDIKIATRHNILNDSNISVPSGRTIRQIAVSHRYAKAFLINIRGFFTNLYKEIKSGDYL